MAAALATAAYHVLQGTTEVVRHMTWSAVAVESLEEATTTAIEEAGQVAGGAVLFCRALWTLSPEVSLR